MADIDFFGYERSNAGQYLYSSDLAAIWFDNNGVGSPYRAGLVQNVQASYQQSVLPRFEAGSSELYWVAGQAQGTVGCGRLVSYGGILDGIKPGQGSTDIQNGILGSIYVKIGKLGGQLRQVSVPQSQLVMSGCVLTAVSLSFTTGALEVSESMSMAVALMKKTSSGGGGGATGLGGILSSVAAGASSIANVTNAGANLANTLGI